MVTVRTPRPRPGLRRGTRRESGIVPVTVMTTVAPARAALASTSTACLSSEDPGDSRATEPLTAITGWGRHVPGRIVTNDELAATLDTSDEWIQARTGIRERRVASPGETTATLATAAARAALAVARLDPTELDLVIVCSITPDFGGMPSVASIVQHALGASRAGAFDLSAACSGWVYGLGVANALAAAGTHRNILLVGAETLSRFVDWTDRSTCVLFGDGAGAIVLQRTGPGGETTRSTGSTALLSLVTGSDGGRGPALAIPAGGSLAPASHATVDARSHFIAMDGREVYRFAITTVPLACTRAVEQAGLTMADIDLVVLHQANVRIMSTIIEALGLPWERAFVNVDRYGNTSAASIPIALAEAVEAGRLQPGHRVLVAGFGGGLTWGAAVLDWRGAPLASP